MSQQEDDLRALAKIMDFLRAVSMVPSSTPKYLHWFSLPCRAWVRQE